MIYILLTNISLSKFLVDYYWKSNNYGDNKGIKHLAYESSKGACYYVSKFYDRNLDNDIFVRTKF